MDWLRDTPMWLKLSTVGLTPVTLTPWVLFVILLCLVCWFVGLLWSVDFMAC
jgi:hypothetical protein